MRALERKGRKKDERGRDRGRARKGSYVVATIGCYGAHGTVKASTRTHMTRVRTINRRARECTRVHIYIYTHTYNRHDTFIRRHEPPAYILILFFAPFFLDVSARPLTPPLYLPPSFRRRHQLSLGLPPSHPPFALVQPVL